MLNFIPARSWIPAYGLTFAQYLDCFGRLPPIAGGANNIAPYVPQQWARTALMVLRNQIAMARLVWRDFEDDVSEQGDTVNVRKPSTFTAADFTPPTVYTDLTPTNVQVVLNKHKHVSFLLGDKEASVSLSGDIDGMRRVAAEHIGPAAMALAEGIESDLLALYVDVAANVVGVTGTDITDAVVVDAVKKMNDLKAPVTGRHFIMSTKDQAALLKTDKWTSAEWDPQNVEMLRRQQFNTKYGFETINWSQMVKVVAGAPDSTKNLAFHQNAFALVMRPLIEAVGGTGAIARTVNDPVSNLALRLTIQYDIDQKAHKVSLDCLYGVKTMDAALGVVVLS